MKAKITIHDEIKTIDLSTPLDISIVLKDSKDNPLAWYLAPPSIEPVSQDDWVGKVSEGASVNFNTIFFNPHAHGTHTECVGHISKEFYSVNEALKTFFFAAEVISVTPIEKGDDLVIASEEIKKKLTDKKPEAVVIRTLPNPLDKKTKQYSHSNWPYLSEETALFLRSIGVKHLLIDQPSVDKEKDDGKLAAHKAFWNYPAKPRHDCTITEFIYVPNTVKDGAYLLNLQMAPFENDASPSRPVLYRLL